MSEEERPTSIDDTLSLNQFIPTCVRSLAKLRHTTHPIAETRIRYTYDRATEHIAIHCVVVLIRKKWRCYFDEEMGYVGDVPVHNPEPELTWRRRKELKFVVHYLDWDDIEFLVSEIQLPIRKKHGSIRHDFLRKIQRNPHMLDDTVPDAEDFDGYDHFSILIDE